MALYRNNSTGFLGEFASNPGAGYSAITAMPTDTVANRVAWWRGLDAYGQTSSWHPSEYRTPQDPAEAALSIQFSSDGALIAADASGNVTDGYLGGTTTVKVFRGSTDVTISEGWSLSKVDQSCTSTLTLSGGVYTLAITNIPLLATTTGYVRITATRTGSTTQTKDFTFLKVLRGANGTSGSNGLNSATVFIYRRATATPTLPSATTTYDFTTKTLTGLNNSWTTTIPAGTDPIWASAATASASTSTDTIASNEWAAPTVLAQNGADGATGSNGLNSATLYIYRRSATAPALPSATTTYTFATKTLTGLNNSWTSTIPSGTDPIYVSTATAVANTATDTIDSSEWAAVAILAQNGSNGATGTRGSRQILVTNSTGVWSDQAAWQGVQTWTGTAPVLSDLVTIAKTDGTAATSKFYAGGGNGSTTWGTWTQPNAYINGNLLVIGTVGADSIAARAITTDKLAIGTVGRNLLHNSGPTLGGELDGWALSFNGTGLTHGLSAGFDPWRPPGEGSLSSAVSGTPASAGLLFDITSTRKIPVIPGGRYEFAGAVSTHRCEAYLFVVFYDATGASVGATIGNHLPTNAVGGDIANWPVSGAFATAPAGSAYALLLIRGITTTEANPNVFACHLYFGPAPTQTAYSPWSPATFQTIIDGENIRTQSIIADSIKTRTLTADRVIIGGMTTEVIANNAVTKTYQGSNTVSGTVTFGSPITAFSTTVTSSDGAALGDVILLLTVSSISADPTYVLRVDGVLSSDDGFSQTMTVRAPEVAVGKPGIYAVLPMMYVQPANASTSRTYTFTIQFSGPPAGTSITRTYSAAAILLQR